MNLNATSRHAEGASATSGRTRASSQRTAEKRDRILDAALIQFAKFGFDGASTPQIAAEAGIRHALITQHFGGKDGLWRAVLRRNMIAVQDYQTARLHGLRGVDAAVALRLLFEDFIRFSASHPHFHLLVNHALNTPDERLEWLVTEFIGPGVNDVCALILDAQKAERFIRGDPFKLYFLFLGAASRVFMVGAEINIVSGESPYSDPYVKEHTELCLSLFFR